MAEADGASTDLAIRMTIKTLAAKGLPKRSIAREVSLSEGTVAITCATWPRHTLWQVDYNRCTKTSPRQVTI